MSKLDFRRLDLSRTYTENELEDINEWLKTKNVGLDVESAKQYNFDVPIDHFELSPTGKLIPKKEAPIEKEAIVEGIILQLRKWITETKYNGDISSSFRVLAVSNGPTIPGPDIALIPRASNGQLNTKIFNPIFVIEVENVTRKPKLEVLIKKYKTYYFTSNIKLVWLIDPINQNIYRLVEEKDGIVRSRKRGWDVISAGDILPNFTLNLKVLNAAVSQETSELLESETDDEQFICSECKKVFEDSDLLEKHFARNHVHTLAE
ncbi:hypothetical protein BC937DRAFT_88929 [Endogone sp. FLAS-F59071]|nr:hypothetical protein BC937DRAFT_88929 [Endogone sp. FLAS-F59071]|eukprot:RUS18314.1 hypothetical protein BC937DRAFT_88929 [Endogone sp. FLAS-F59071]